MGEIAGRAALIVVGLGLASGLISILEGGALGIADASLVYLVPVVIVATRFGTGLGVSTALASFVIYDFFFTEPRYSLVVADNREWLELVLFLFVALTVGRLSALGQERAALAETRARESQAQFSVSRQLATQDLDQAIPAIVARITDDAGLLRAWVTLDREGDARPIADTDPARPLPSSSIIDVLVRTPNEAPARWVRAHDPKAGRRPAPGPTQLRVRIEADGDGFGSLWALHPNGRPGPEPTRLLALTADQLGFALHREHLRRSAMDAEISRRSDTLKSSLLTSVSHDLRTPLAGIRAAAGGLLDEALVPDREATVRAAAEIDAAAARLDRMVRGLLDLGRIESGSLRPAFEAFDLRSVVDAAVDRARPALGNRPIQVQVPDALPPVRLDGLLFDEILANLLENVARHAPAPAPCRLRAALRSERIVVLVVEDGGPGVDGRGLERLLADYTHRAANRSDRRAMGGIGLAVVRGFATAMGIEMTAERSALGGLAVLMNLTTIDIPPEADEP